jgi:hypothetical protein
MSAVRTAVRRPLRHLRDFHGRPESYIPFKNPCTRESIVTISQFY